MYTCTHKLCAIIIHWIYFYNCLYLLIVIIINSIILVYNNYSDFLVKMVDLTDTSKISTMEGHDAPVLCVRFDPLVKYLVSIHVPHLMFW